jgi:undecaprenyl-diphosphatase
MSSSLTDRRHHDHQAFTRGRLRRVWDVIFIVLRWAGRRAHSAYLTFGIFLLIGTALAISGTYLFVKLASRVAAGKTQAFDDAVLTWFGAHRLPSLDAIMVDVTALGTGTVVVMIVTVAALFLWLTRHHYSAILLVVATVGSIILNNLLKMGFERPRPDIVSWVGNAHFYSFPSGHAMSATVAYVTVAYLAGRLLATHTARVAVIATALLIILLICVSRLYLGVHYPSDVIAGVTIGLAWAGFCMAAIEAIQLYARRNAPELMRVERPAPKDESVAA